MVIDADGNVGIGTTSPDAKLHIFEDLNDAATSAPTASESYQLFINGAAGSTGDTVGIALGTTDGNDNVSASMIAIDAGSAGIADLAFYTKSASNTAERMRITSAGLLGIGTDSPDGKLSVRTAAAQNSVYLDTYSDTTDHLNALYFRKSANDTAGTRTATADGDIIALLEFQGVDSAGNWDDGAFIRVSQTGSIGSRVPTKMEFATYSNSAEKIPFIIDANSRISLSNNDSGTQNTVFGHSAGLNIDAGTNYNTFIGYVSAGGATLDDATNNTAVGYATLNALTTGDHNTAIGTGSGAAINAGIANTVIGSGALDLLTSGNHNIAIGVDAANAMDAGESHNYAIGSDSMGAMDEGASGTIDYNIAIGYTALSGGAMSSTNAVTGCIAIGHFSLDATGTNAHAGTIAIGYNALTACTSGSANTAVGYGSMDALTTGSNNTGLGDRSLSATDDGANNTAVGAFAMESGNCGDNNTAVGYNSLRLCTGGNNTGFGEGTMQDLVEGTDNVAIGKAAFGGALDATADASVGNVFIGKDAGGGAWVTAVSNYNIGIGYQSMDAAMNGALNNLAVGYRSLGALTEGDHNIALGSDALLSLNTGTNNVAIGNFSGDAMTASSNCVLVGKNTGGAINSADADGTVAVGHSALTALTGGQKNIAIGYQAQLESTIGDSNIAIGYNAMFGGAGMQNDLNIAIGGENAAGSVLAAMGGQWTSNRCEQNIAIGTGSLAGAMNDAHNNTAVGYKSLNAVTTGDNNIGLGSGSGEAITTGVQNICIGGASGDAMTTSSNNVLIGMSAGTAIAAGQTNTDGTVAVGKSALASLTSGIGNTAVGYQSGNAITTGGYSTFLGYNAGLVHTTGGYNMAIGYGAMDDTNAGSNSLGSTENTFIGVDSGGGTWADTSSSYNVGIGNYVMDDALDGASYNTAVGQNSMSALTEGDYNTALGRASAHSLTTGTQNVLLGYGAVTSAASGQNQIVLGYETTGVGNNSVTLGNASVTAVYAAQDSGAHSSLFWCSFPATQAASAGANILDDYQEGTWTPVLAVDSTDLSNLDGNNNCNFDIQK